MWNSMKVREVIEQLSTYNQDAELIGVFNYQGFPVKSIGCGGSDGCTKENCSDVSLWFQDSKEESTNDTVS